MPISVVSKATNLLNLPYCTAHVQHLCNQVHSGGHERLQKLEPGSNHKQEKIGLDKHQNCGEKMAATCSSTHVSLTSFAG